MNRCTAIVINFLREPYLFKCLSSLKDTYPDIDILVGENGKYTKEKRTKVEQYGKYVEVDYDAGVCRGRNTLVKMVKTEYVLVGDDDFFYDKKANLKEILDFLDKHPEVDLVGGRIIENEKLRDYQGFMKKEDGALRYQRLELTNFEEDIIRYKKCDITFNFFIARTETVKKALWDENIKVAYEHSDFFLKLKEIGATVVFTPDMLVVHKPLISEPLNPEYGNFRRRKSDKKYFFRKHKISYAIDMNGFRDTVERDDIKRVDFLITTLDRRQSLEKLLFSIVKYYPDANIYIGDNGHFEKNYYLDLWGRLVSAGLKHRPCAFNVGFDRGLSYTRNYLVQNTPNMYKLILDDDFVFTEDTNIGQFVDYLDDNPEVGAVGGSLMQDGNKRHYEGFLQIVGTELHYQKLDYNNLAYVNDCDIIFNFALFRSKLFGDCLWDEYLKITGEHTDFFLRLKNTKWKVRYMPSVSVGHEQVFTENYKVLRQRMEFFRHVFEKHDLTRIINFNGVVHELDGQSIKRYRV